VAVKHIPEGYHSVTPYIVVEGAEGLIDFMKSVFGARERMRMPGPNNTVGHAEMEIGDSVVMLADAGSVDGNQPFPGMLNLYVEDVDKVYQAALAAGATSIRELTDQFYGDRSGGVRDQWGNFWWISTHVEDVSPEEMERRSAEFLKQQGQG
jgi:PhnB protein